MRRGALTLQQQGGGCNMARIHQRLCPQHTAGQGRCDIALRQRADMGDDQSRAKIAVGVQLLRGLAGVDGPYWPERGWW